MEHERNVQEIRHQLVVVAEMVENGGVSTKMQEVFVADLLGKSRGWVAGQPVPNRQANEPGVDLKFPKEGTAVQVTKERSRSKINETLAVCEHHLDAKEYPKVVLFYTGRSGGRRRRGTVKSPKGTWTIRIPQDTWDYKTVIDDVIQHPDKAKAVLQSRVSQRVTRREDAIAEARAGNYVAATALFEEAGQIASDEGRASASRALDNTHLSDLARALELDAAITQALNEEMGKAILTLDRLASDLLTNPAGQSKAGKRLTNMIGHVALWLNLRSEGWQAAEIDSQAGIVPGVASLEHWPEDSKVTPRIGAEDRYWAAKYLAAIALIRLNGSDQLARAVEGSRKFALAFETLMAYERRNLAIIQYDGQSLWRHAAELEGLLRQALENPGQESLRAERRIEPESGLQPGAAQVEGILRTCAIRETLEGQSSDTGSEGLEKTRSLYEEGRKYCGRLGWLEAMLSATARLQDLQRREDVLLYRTLNAIEKDTRMGGAQGTQYETWKWATILWLFSHSTDGGTLIREALASWLDVRGTWERPRGSREQTAQRLAALLWKMMKDNPSWGRDADDGAKAQLQAAAEKTAQLPKFGDE